MTAEKAAELKQLVESTLNYTLRADYGEDLSPYSLSEALRYLGQVLLEVIAELEEKKPCGT